MLHPEYSILHTFSPASLCCPTHATAHLILKTVLNLLDLSSSFLVVDAVVVFVVAVAVAAAVAAVFIIILFIIMILVYGFLWKISRSERRANNNCCHCTVHTFHCIAPSSLSYSYTNTYVKY